MVLNINHPYSKNCGQFKENNVAKAEGIPAEYCKAEGDELIGYILHLVCTIWEEDNKTGITNTKALLAWQNGT